MADWLCVYVSIIKTNVLILFREIITAYFENHTEPVNNTVWENAEFSSVKRDSAYSKHWNLKGSGVDQMCRN